MRRLMLASGILFLALAIADTSAARAQYWAGMAPAIPVVQPVTSYRLPVTLPAPVVAPSYSSFYSPAVPVASAPVVTSYSVPIAPAPVMAPTTVYRVPTAPLMTTPAVAAPMIPATPVVISSKVYVPGQPVRNLLRAVTP